MECGCLLYRDRSVARQTFAGSGDYIRILNQDPTEAFAFFEESMELSRRFRALKLWLSLQYHGRRAFRDSMLQDLRRHRTRDSEAILRRVIARGRVYISNASIGGQFALRACFVNHRATDDDVRAIVSEVIAAAEEVNG
jgi:aromatic-L-amino-acid/L-tryptophan decarboxylase